MTAYEITAAAMHWHAANIKRLKAGAVKRREQQHNKERTGYASASPATDLLASEAKRRERAALRVLGKACAKSLEVCVIDVCATESTSTLFLETGQPARIDRAGGKQSD